MVEAVKLAMGDEEFQLHDDGVEGMDDGGMSNLISYTSNFSPFFCLRFFFRFFAIFQSILICANRGFASLKGLSKLLRARVKDVASAAPSLPGRPA